MNQVVGQQLGDDEHGLAPEEDLLGVVSVGDLPSLTPGLHLLMLHLP